MSSFHADHPSGWFFLLEATMGGRGSWSQTAKGEQIIVAGRGGGNEPSDKLLTAKYQTIAGNMVSQEATFGRVEKE
ncbi:MAG: hypothetical protein RR719_09700, partial [Akkermansia sp.]